MARMQKYYDEQERRQKLFPENRIAFYPKSTQQDITALTAYQDGMITFDKLRKNIAYNNYLEKMWPNGIPESIMRNELKIIGYERKHA